MTRALSVAAVAMSLLLTGCTTGTGVIVHREYHHAQRYAPAHYTLTVSDGHRYRSVHVRRNAGRGCVVGAHYPACTRSP